MTQTNGVHCWRCCCWRYCLRPAAKAGECSCECHLAKQEDERYSVGMPQQASPGAKAGGRPSNTAFGRALRRKGITSEQLAKITGYSETAVRSWRAGVRIPQRGALILIAAALGIKPSAVLRLIKTAIKAK